MNRDVTVIKGSQSLSEGVPSVTMLSTLLVAIRENCLIADNIPLPLTMRTYKSKDIQMRKQKIHVHCSC